MKTRVLNIADEQPLPAFIDEAVVGVHLRQIIAELLAVHGENQTDSPAKLSDIIGGRKEAVLAQGTSAIPREAFAQLITNPYLLIQLQELVLVEGGEYWRRLEQTSSAEPAISQTRLTLLDATTDQGATPVSRPSAWYRRPVVFTMFAAACVLVAMMLVIPWGGFSTETAWGWNRDDALPQNANRTEYLLQVASGGEAWFDQRPTKRDAISTRLEEFRQGCSRLILADHQPLPEADHQWLVEKCKSWRKKIDGHMQRLNTGADPISVRNEADETARKLVSTIRERALPTGKDF